MRVAADVETFSVEPSAQGERLDRWLARHVAGLSRAQAQRLLQLGAVSVAGRRARKGDVVRAGDVVSVTRIDVAAVPDPALPLCVRLETPELVIVAKPAGQPSAPLRPGELGTLANPLLARYPEMAGVGYAAREPGLVQRLDTGTSGLVIAARSVLAFNELRRALEARQITKKYLAVVGGVVPADAGCVENTLGPHPTDPRRVAPLTRAVQHEHRTRWRRLQTRGPWTLLELEAPKAYRHQVRVHLAGLGCPIAGDALYGGAAAPELGARHALHASYVAWSGTRELAGFEVAEALPGEMGILMAGDA